MDNAEELMFNDIMLEQFMMWPAPVALAVHGQAASFLGWVEAWRQNKRTFRQYEYRLPQDFYKTLEVSGVSPRRRRNSDVGRGAHASHDNRDNFRFVNVEIPEELDQTVCELGEDIPGVVERFFSYTTSGWDVLVKRKRDSNDWFAMVIVDDPHVPGGRCGVTAWSDDPVWAVVALVAKWEYILKRTIPAPEDAGAVVRRRYR